VHQRQRGHLPRHPDSTVLKDGDIVNCDVTIYLDGVHGDTNATFLVGEVSEQDRRLVEVTRECLEVGIAAVRPGGRIRDIGKAIQTHAEGTATASSAPSSVTASGAASTATRRSSTTTTRRPRARSCRG
jgi:methionine aminopeptidase